MNEKYNKLMDMLEKIVATWSSSQKVQSMENREAGPHSQVMSSCGCNCHSQPFHPWGSPPIGLSHQNTHTADLAKSRPEIPALIYQIETARASALMPEKSYHAVVENLSEPDGAVKRIKQSFDSDSTLMRDICTVAEINPPVEVWRHPTRSPTKSRPVKVKFGSVDVSRYSNLVIILIVCRFIKYMVCMTSRPKLVVQ